MYSPCASEPSLLRLIRRTRVWRRPRARGISGTAARQAGEPAAPQRTPRRRSGARTATAAVARLAARPENRCSTRVLLAEAKVRARQVQLAAGAAKHQAQGHRGVEASTAAAASSDAAACGSRPDGCAGGSNDGAGGSSDCAAASNGGGAPIGGLYSLGARRGCAAVLSAAESAATATAAADGAPASGCCCSCVTAGTTTTAASEDDASRAPRC